MTASLKHGLVGAWCPSVTGATGFTVPDLSGRGSHASLQNMTQARWVPNGGSLSLDFDGGTNDAIQGTINEAYFKTYTNPFTFSMWAKIRAWRGTVGIDDFFAGMQLGTANFQMLGLSVNFKRLTFIGDTNGVTGWDFGSATPIGATQLSLNRWYHLCGTRTSSGVYTVFIDGVADGSLTVTSDIVINNGTMRIGGHYGGNTTYDADGFMDDIRIYNRVLTPAEIRQLASKRGVGLRTQKQTMFYQFPSASRRRKLITGMP